jgi:parallel beta-helix repeat protein
MLKLFLRRTSTKDRKPTVSKPAAAGELAQGELWLNNNPASPALFARASDDTLIEFGQQEPFVQAGAGAKPRTLRSKLRDVVSVKDFGAVGDGVADDTAAIQAAIDSSGSNSTIHLESGIYLISSAIKIDGTARNLSGVSLVGGATIKLATGVQRQNIIEAVSGDNHAVKGLKLVHNADRGGHFGRHASTDGLTANSGATLKTTATAGAATVDLQATTLTGKIGPGDTLQFTGDATVYTVTNLVTAAGNELLGVAVTPALAKTITAGTSAGVYQLPRYKTKAALVSGASTLSLDALNIESNSAPFPAVALRVGEQFQFLKRRAGSLNEYVVDPAHITVYTVTNEVPATSGGIGKEFLNVSISPPLAHAVSADTFITSIQDANNRYSCGIYLASSDNVTVENVEIDQAVWHGILIGTGPRQAPGVTTGGDGAHISGCRITNFGGNGIAGGGQPRMVIIGNSVKKNTSGVGCGIFPDSGCEGSMISGNTIDSVFYGITSFGCSKLTISNNDISNSTVGVLIDSSSYSCVIDSNIIAGGATSTAGIYLRKGTVVNFFAFSAIVVSNNLIRGIASGPGITARQFGAAVTATPLDDNVFITISDNIISESGTYGIELISTIRSSVSGNNVAYSKSHGIFVDHCQTISLQDNIVTNWGLAANAGGIFVRNTDDIFIGGNHASKIPYTTASTQYGLQVDANVTNLKTNRNFFKGDTAQANVNLLNIDSTLTVNATLDFPSIPPQSATDLTVPVPGARPLDIVRVSVQPNGIGSLIFTSFVSANDVVTIRTFNPTAIAWDPAALAFRVQVDKYSA